VDRSGFGELRPHIGQGDGLTKRGGINRADDLRCVRFAGLEPGPGCGRLVRVEFQTPQHAMDLRPAADSLDDLLAQVTALAEVHRPHLIGFLEQVSLGDFHWIGNFVKSNVVIITWYKSSVKNLTGAKLKEATLGTTGVGAESDQIPLLINALTGTKFKLIRGYEGAAQINAAMERGELDGRGANLWASYKAINPNEIRDRKFNYIVQLGTQREPELADVPLLSDLVKGDARKEAIVRFVTFANENARPVAAPPGVPSERVEILRRAFDQTMKDAGFLADARRLRLEITPSSGEEVERSVHQVLATPPEIIRETAAVMAVGQR